MEGQFGKLTRLQGVSEELRPRVLLFLCPVTDVAQLAAHVAQLGKQAL